MRVQLRLVHFLNVDEDFALSAFGEVLLELFDLRALAADDDAGPRGANGDAKLVAGPVHFDRADTRGFQTIAQVFLQLQIFLQQLRVTLLGEPARPPGLIEAQPEAIWMYFLSHFLNLCLSQLPR